ncbi:uncharacterized protein TNCV_4273801 [Trichonephila clavipes]|nr:uncharacterized protein TNCV_4273801 [Trichonephila clavipes]
MPVSTVNHRGEATMREKAQGKLEKVDATANCQSISQVSFSTFYTMRDEHGHLVQMNGMSGPLLMGRGIPIAMVPVLPVVNGNETAAVSIPPVPAPAPPPAPALGNGARECKYEDKNRIYSPQQNSQSKNINRKLPTNGAHRMPVRPLFNSKSGQAQVRAPSGSQVSGAPLGAHSYRPQGCVGTYRYNIPPAPPPPYASFPAVTVSSRSIKLVFNFPVFPL